MALMHSTETRTAPLDSIVSAPVNEDMREWIDAEAKRQRRSRAEILRFAIEEYRERQHATGEAA